MNQQTPSPSIRIIVLAAGKSSRFGAAKLVQHLHGKPLLQHALLAAQGACKGSVNLVVGHDQDIVVAASAGMSDRIVVNSDYREGIGASIAAGVRESRHGADAILIVLADQPLVTAAHLNNIIDNWSGANNEIVASSYDGTHGPPILFPTSAFNTLCELTGDTGAKEILNSGDFIVRTLDFPPASIDVDLPEDLRGLNQD